MTECLFPCSHYVYLFNILTLYVIHAVCQPFYKQTEILSNETMAESYM